MRQFRFSPALPERPAFTIGDAVIVLGIATLLYGGLRLALRVPAVIAGPDISLSPLALPWYALLSVGRMAAHIFCPCCSAYSRLRRRAPHRANGAHARADVLQNVPILLHHGPMV
jgi:NitT/TauT family transport system permease protein